MKATPCLERILKTLAFLLFAVFTANAVAVTSYEYISRSTDGLQTGYGQHPQVTPDGRYVVYGASASTLVTPNAPGYQIYLYDRTTHTTELISVDNTGAYGNATSDHPTVSDDGCRVVFTSYATNLVNGAGSRSDVFVRDLCTNPKQTRLVSSGVDGLPGWAYDATKPAQSAEARISGDGNYATFVTYANNINGTPTSCGTCNVVVRKDLDTGAINIVSVKADGTTSYGKVPDISYDGSRIVFWAYNYYIDGTSGWDYWLWDATLPGSVSVASTGSNGARQVSPLGSVSGVHSPGISGDGRYVAFNSGFDAGTSSLTAEGGNGYYQVYVKDTQTGTLALASVSPSGALADNNCGGTNGYDRPSFSYNGRYIAFTCSANNLATSTTYASSQLPLVRDLVANQTTLLADRPIEYTLGLSSNGRFVAFSTRQTTLDSNFPNTQGLYLADLNICPSSTSPISSNISSSSGTGDITVTASSTCTWTATSNASWITVSSGSSGSGNGSVVYSVAANTDTAARTGTLTIGGQTFTVTQAGAGTAMLQTISFGSAPTITIGGTGTVTATATSGLPVTYSSTPASVCTVSSTGTVTGVAAGTCTIAANQAGNAGYSAATQVTQTITISAPVHGVNTDSVQRLYLAYFNRPADPAGLAAFEALLSPTVAATQAQLTALAAYISSSAEYAALYAGQSNAQVIDSLYMNLFGRHCESTVVQNTWAGWLTDGTYTFDQIALQLTFSAQGTDATAIANKLAAATAFTTALDTSSKIAGYSGTAAAARVRTWLATVTSDAATLAAAIASVVTVASPL